MIFRQSNRKSPAQTATRQKTAASAAAHPGVFKLHSIGALLKGRHFVAKLEVAGVRYICNFVPATGALTDGKFKLTGSLNVTTAREGAAPQPRSLQRVTATLVAMQGGIGSAPPLKKTSAEVYQPGPGIPPVESSGSLSFAGVLFFKLTPLNAAGLGLKADLSAVQLNARFAPTDDRERAVHAAYSQIADAVLGAKTDSESANQAIEELNRLLAKG